MSKLINVLLVNRLLFRPTSEMLLRQKFCLRWFQS